MLLSEALLTESKSLKSIYYDLQNITDKMLRSSTVDSDQKFFIKREYSYVEKLTDDSPIDKVKKALYDLAYQLAASIRKTNPHSENAIACDRYCELLNPRGTTHSQDLATWGNAEREEKRRNTDAINARDTEEAKKDIYHRNHHAGQNINGTHGAEPGFNRSTVTQANRDNQSGLYR